MNKKGAIELSMTTIIVIIIGVVLLSLGLIWVKNTLGHITDITEEAFLQADREIREKMTSTEKFYVGGYDIEIKVGKSKTVTTGIQNLIGKDASFVIKVEGASNNDEESKWFTTPEAINIPAGEKKGIPVVINVPKTAIPDTTHLFKFTAKYIENGQEVEYDSQIINLKIT